MTLLSTRLTLRSARREDVPQLVALINALNIHEGLAASMTVAHADYMLFSPVRAVAMRCRVALMSAQVAGFILYYVGYDTASTSVGYHIADMYVDPSHRRASLGRALMADVAALCLEEGGEWCSLTAARGNMAANAFYDALGFVSPDVTFRAMGRKGLRLLVDTTN